VEDAVGSLSDDEGAVALGGGTSVGLLVGQRLLQPTKLVWLGRIDSLRRVRVEDGRLSIGAGVTLAQVSDHPLVRSELPALASAASVVGNPRVRAVATLGGAIAHADPRQDVPPALLALRATAVVVGTSGQRRIELQEFFRGFMETALGPGDVITAIEVPLPGAQNVYLRYNAGSQSDYPTVGAAAVLTHVSHGRVSARVALAGVAPTPVLLPDVAGAGDERHLDDVGKAALEAARPTDDRLGSAAYKRAMAEVWARRAVAACLSPPAGG